MKNKSVVYAILVGVIISVIGISVAYAALSANLDVTFQTVTSGGASWNIGFNTNGTKTGTKSGLNSNTDGITCGDATITANSFTIGATTLVKPGDTCTWTATIQNTGDIDGKITGITITKPKNEAGTELTCTITGKTTMVCGNITYNVTGTGLTEGSTIAKKTGSTPGSITATITASYTGADVSGTAEVQKNAKFTYVFGQK